MLFFYIFITLISFDVFVYNVALMHFANTHLMGKRYNIDLKAFILL